MSFSSFNSLCTPTFHSSCHLFEKNISNLDKRAEMSGALVGRDVGAQPGNTWKRGWFPLPCAATRFESVTPQILVSNSLRWPCSLREAALCESFHTFWWSEQLVLLCVHCVWIISMRSTSTIHVHEKYPTRGGIVLKVFYIPNAVIIIKSQCWLTS